MHVTVLIKKINKYKPRIFFRRKSQSCINFTLHNGKPQLSDYMSVELYQEGLVHSWIVTSQKIRVKHTKALYSQCQMFFN